MRNPVYAVITALMIIVICATGCVDAQDSREYSESSWQEEFGLAKRTLVPTGRNQYFILEPGFQLVLESRFTKLVIIVLDETKEVDGVITRVVEEREWIRGELYEVSRNFFGIDQATKDVFYFGEDVDFYRGGKVVDHHGAWLAGKNGAKPGLMMPGRPRLGIKYYQEIAPGVAMDRAEVIDLNDVLDTPAGRFTQCLTTREGTALNLREVEFKTYAPGIGLIQDQSLLLTQYGFIEQ